MTKATLTPFIIVITITAAISLWMVVPYILPLIMGGLLSILTKPFFKWLINKKVSPKLASTIVIFCIVILFIVPLGFFTSLAIKQGITIGKYISSSQTFNLQEVINRVSSLKIVEVLELTPYDVNNSVHAWIQEAGGALTTMLLSAVKNLPRITLQLVLAVITCFFLLIDGERFLSWLKTRVMLDEDVHQKVIDSFKSMAVGSIHAMFVTGFAQSTVILLAFLILGIPAAFLAASATFVFSWIPMLGCSPVWITAAIYLYLQGQIGKAVAMVLIGLFVGIIDNIIKPIILKGSSDMHPLISLVAIFGGINLFGILGVFIGPILLGVLIALLQIWPHVAKRFGLINQK